MNITRSNRSTAAVINALRAKEYAAYRYGTVHPPTREEYEGQLDAVRIGMIEINKH